MPNRLFLSAQPAAVVECFTVHTYQWWDVSQCIPTNEGMDDGFKYDNYRNRINRNRVKLRQFQRASMKNKPESMKV
jgi:hypothetical protein